MARSITAIRVELQERLKWSLADENRDSRKFATILDELAEHIQQLENKPDDIGRDRFPT
jgi:hypothetical protein